MLRKLASHPSMPCSLSLSVFLPFVWPWCLAHAPCSKQENLLPHRRISCVDLLWITALGEEQKVGKGPVMRSENIWGTQTVRSSFLPRIICVFSSASILCRNSTKSVATLVRLRLKPNCSLQTYVFPSYLSALH